MWTSRAVGNPRGVARWCVKQLSTALFLFDCGFCRKPVTTFPEKCFNLPGDQLQYPVLVTAMPPAVAIGLAPAAA
jgi:hypothetical protein